MNRKILLLIIFIAFSFASCDTKISKDDAKVKINDYFANNPPTFTFYIPIKDSFLWVNSECNNGDSNYIKNNVSDAYIKYYMHLIRNLKIFGAMDYHFVKEPNGCRIITEFTDKFKALIKSRTQRENDGNGEHITIISGSIKADIQSIEAGTYKDGRNASIVKVTTEFTPNDIRNIFSTEKNEGKNINTVYLYLSNSGWVVDPSNLAY